MEYRKIGDNYYVRMDRGDEIISTLLEICEKESIPSAVFSGIGGCQSAELQVFIPETGSFETERLEGMLELVYPLMETWLETIMVNYSTILMLCFHSKRKVNMVWQGDI